MGRWRCWRIPNHCTIVASGATSSKASLSPCNRRYHMIGHFSSARPVRLAALLLAVVALAIIQGSTLRPRVVAAAPRRPFPQHLAYAPGTIRPNLRTQAEQDDDV